MRATTVMASGSPEAGQLLNVGKEARAAANESKGDHEASFVAPRPKWPGVVVEDLMWSNERGCCCSLHEG